MEFGGHVYQQTDCAPLVADLFLNSYEADFVHLQKSKFKKQKKHPLISRYRCSIIE